MRGKSANYLLGGVHLTEYEYLPFLLLKRTFCTECGLQADGVDLVRKSLSNMTTLQDLIYPMSIKSGFKGRFNDSRVVSEEIALHYRIPWFLQCNTHRFPTWYEMNELDSRLTAPKSQFSYVC